MILKSQKIAQMKIKVSAKILFLIFFTPLLVMLFTSETDNRSMTQLAVAISTCLLLDYVLHRIFTKRNTFPTSGLLTSMGVFVLSTSPYLWTYVLIAVLSIASKHFIRVGNHHLFNPSNFGTLIVWLYFPDLAVPAMINWSGYYGLPVFIFLTGLLLAKKVKRLPLVCSYLACFFLLVLLRVLITDSSFTFIMLPFHGASIYLFLFYMLTDPATTPGNYKGQIVFGLLVASIDMSFRVGQSVKASLIALALTTCAYWLFVYISKRPKVRFSYKSA